MFFVFILYTRSGWDVDWESGCISDFLGVQKWVTEYTFAMVCDVKWGFGRSDKKSKFPKNAPFASTFWWLGCEWFWRVEVDDLRSELPVVIVSDVKEGFEEFLVSEREVKFLILNIFKEVLWVKSEVLGLFY